MQRADLEARLRATAPAAAGPGPALSELAAAARLLDVGYAMYDSPVGRLLLAATPAGLAQVAYLDEAPQLWLERLAARISPRVLHAPAAVDVPRRQLDEYFAGRRREFELALDWRLTRGFGRRVLKATAAVPFGAVTSYKQVADAAGSLRGFRAAGNALCANPLPIVVPCHRVLATGGGLGGYTGGVERKRMLLALEGALAQ